MSKPETGFGRSEWILSRPLYRFVRFEFKSVARPQREQALELQIRQWSPFARTGKYVLWHQDTAQIWAWDADRIESALLENKLDSRNTAIVPETLLRGRRLDGAFLLACLDGVEGQAWTHDAMIGSRWWPKPPAANEWLNFQRDAGISPENQSGEVPTVLIEELGQKPWARSADLAHASILAGRAEQWIVPVVSICLFAATVWSLAQLVKLNSAISTQAAELETLAQKSGPIIEARGKSLEALNRIKLLQSIDPYPDQLGLMARVADTLPSKDGAYLKEWDFQNGKLKLQIASASKLLSSEYIKLFESVELFKNVQAAPANDPNALALSMEVIPFADLKPGVENHESTIPAAALVR